MAREDRRVGTTEEGVMTADHPIAAEVITEAACARCGKKTVLGAGGWQTPPDACEIEYGYHYPVPEDETDSPPPQGGGEVLNDCRSE